MPTIVRKPGQPIGTTQLWSPQWTGAVSGTPIADLQGRLSGSVNWDTERQNYDAWKAKNPTMPYSWDQWVRKVALGYYPGSFKGPVFQGGSAIPPNWMDIVSMTIGAGQQTNAASEIAAKYSGRFRPTQNTTQTDLTQRTSAIPTPAGGAPEASAYPTGSAELIKGTPPTQKPWSSIKPTPPAWWDPSRLIRGSRKIYSG